MHDCGVVAIRGVLNGLTAAAHLAKAGCSVGVSEARVGAARTASRSSSGIGTDGQPDECKRHQETSNIEREVRAK